MEVLKKSIFKNIDFKGSNVSYSLVGKGKPFVLLHGFCESKEMWAPLLSHFQYFQSILIDLPGFGESVLPENLSIDYMADAVNAVLQAEKIDTCSVAGHSMGGYVALSLAQRYTETVKGVCLFHSTAYADTEEKKRDRRLGMELIRRNRSAYIEGFIPNLFKDAELPELKDAIAATRKMSEATASETMLAALQAMSERPDRCKLLKDLTVPVCIIAGGGDKVIPLEKIRPLTELPADLSFHVIKNAGHSGHFEAANDCGIVLKAFAELSFS